MILSGLKSTLQFLSFSFLKSLSLCFVLLFFFGGQAGGYDQDSKDPADPDTTPIVNDLNAEELEEHIAELQSEVERLKAKENQACNSGTATPTRGGREPEEACMNARRELKDKKGELQEAKKQREGPERCDDSLLDISPEAYMQQAHIATEVSSTVHLALQADNKASFREAHETQAKLRGGMAVGATAAYFWCTRKVSKCIEVCEEENALCSSSGIWQNRWPDINCRDNKHVMDKCERLRPQCTATGMTAMTSAASALQSVLAANLLKDGDADDKAETEKENTPEGLSFGEQVQLGAGSPKISQPGSGTSASGDKLADLGSEDQGGEEDEPKGSGAYIPGGSTSGNSSSNLAGLASKGFKGAVKPKRTSAGDSNDEDEDDEDISNSYPARRLAGGTFSPSSASAGGNKIGNRGRHGAGRGRGGGVGSKANRGPGGSGKSFSRRGSLGVQAGVHDSIFKKMSRVIQGYCSRGEEKCL